MSELAVARRYALYFAPALDTSLDEFGRNWLGRDARTGEPVEPELPETISRELWHSSTTSARRYGFHGTLKPPFRLAPGTSLEELDQAIQEFTSSYRAFKMPLLQVSKLGRFLALTLSAPCEDLHALAANCVIHFDRFRMAPTEEETAKRMSPSHSEAEREYVLRWGYPYVLDTWKFHMTLTNSLQPQVLLVFEEHLLERSKEVCAQPLVCDAVCLFEEPALDAPLLLMKRYDLSL